MPGSFPALGAEFAFVAGSAAKAGGGEDAVPRVRRSWVNVPDDGQVSAVLWGCGPPEVVFLHEAGRSARAWDEVALGLGRPSVAIDLPGHGRSDWRRNGRYEPRQLAAAIAEAIRSLAPRASLVVGSGLGGRTALALITTPQAAFVPRLALIDTLPGTAGRGAAGRGREAGPRAEVPRFDDVTLWEELAGLANPAFVIHGENSSRLTAADLLELKRRAPRVALLTIPGVAEDVVASQPATLASQLSRLVSVRRGVDQ
jgi:pimeloyl-ACP methyl ester carboxylesterase